MKAWWVVVCLGCSSTESSSARVVQSDSAADTSTSNDSASAADAADASAPETTAEASTADSSDVAPAACEQSHVIVGRCIGPVGCWHAMRAADSNSTCATATDCPPPAVWEPGVKCSPFLGDAGAEQACLETAPGKCCSRVTYDYDKMIDGCPNGTKVVP